MPGTDENVAARERVALLGLRRLAGRDADHDERLRDRGDRVLRTVGQERAAVSGAADHPEARELAELVRQHRELLGVGTLARATTVLSASRTSASVIAARDSSGICTEMIAVTPVSVADEASSRAASGCRRPAAR